MALGKGCLKRSVFLLGFFAVLISSRGYAGLRLQIVQVHPAQVLWEKPITLTPRFTLVHRNSIYDVLVWEAFRISPEGSLWLSGIKSDSPRVLEYYGLETTQRSWITLARKIESLKIRVTVNGRFLLDFNQEKIALSQMVPDGTLVEIRPRKISEEQ